MSERQNPEKRSFWKSLYSDGLEGLVLYIVTFVCFALAIIDFFGGLDSINWLRDRLPTLTIVLIVGFIFSFRKTKERIEAIGSKVNSLDGMDAKVEQRFKKLESSLRETITNANADNCAYKFFLCPPVTSYIKFNSSGKITADSINKNKLVNDFAVGLKQGLEEKFSGKVYYGGEELAREIKAKGRDYAKSDFSKYVINLQAASVTALYSTNIFIAIVPFSLDEASRYPNSIFEGGIAAGRKIRSLYFVTSKDSLPPIIANGKLNHTIDVIENANIAKIVSAGDPDGTTKDEIIRDIRELIT